MHRLKLKLHALREDPHMREVAKGTLLAFVLKIGGSGLAFTFNVAVARLLGAEGAGIFFLALAVTTIATVIGRLGLDNALLKNIASAAAEEKWGQVKGYFSTGIKMALFASGAVSLILFVSASWISTELFKKPELAEPLRWMSLSILPFAILNLQAESLKGLKNIRDAMTVQGIGVPLVSLVLIYPLYQFSGVVGVVISYVLATISVVLLGLWAWHREISKKVGQKDHISTHVLWKSSRSMMVIAFLNGVMIPWAPLFMLGIWSSSEDVGIFGAALRLSMLVSFMLVAGNNIVAPKLAQLYVLGDMQMLGQVARRSTLMTALLSTPVFLVMIFNGEWVMGLFGKDFVQGGMVLAILTVGQLVNVATGAVGYLLMMSGHEDTFRKISLLSTIFLFTIGLIAIPTLGGVGAALATTLAVTINNLGAVFAVRKYLGINMLITTGRK